MDFRRIDRDHVDFIRLDHNMVNTVMSLTKVIKDGEFLRLPEQLPGSLDGLCFMNFLTQRPIRTDFPMQMTLGRNRRPLEANFFKHNSLSHETFS
jgi:hypothetical protein